MDKTLIHTHQQSPMPSRLIEAALSATKAGQRLGTKDALSGVRQKEYNNSRSAIAATKYVLRRSCT